MKDRVLPPRSSETRHVTGQTDPGTRAKKCLENKDGRVRGISDKAAFKKRIFWVPLRR